MPGGKVACAIIMVGVREGSVPGGEMTCAFRVGIREGSVPEGRIACAIRVGIREGSVQGGRSYLIVEGYSTEVEIIMQAEAWLLLSRAAHITLPIP